MTHVHLLLEILRTIPKTFFSLNDVRKFAKINDKSLPVMLTRLVKNAKLQRIIRGYFTFDIGRVDFEEFACILKKPSYISLEYALYHHGLLNQVPESITLVTPEGSRVISCSNGKNLEYAHVKENLYFGYEIAGNALMATKEKALLDELYLINLKKRRLTIDKEWFKKINGALFKKWLKKYPPYMAKFLP